VDVFQGRGDGHGNVGGHPRKCVRNAFSARGFVVDTVAAVMVHGGAKVPAWDRMWRPGATHSGLFVDQDTDAGGRQRCSIEVEESMHMCVSREMCMETA
jgi:hypothetical protein